MRLNLSDIDEVTCKVGDSSCDCRRWSTRMLQRRFDEFRRRAAVDRCEGSPTDWIGSLGGLLIESLRRTLGVELYPTQIQAGLLIAAGKIAEMQTGEGKTFAGFLPACLMAMNGLGVHVVCPNEYLADRDAGLLGESFGNLGLTCRFLPNDAEADEKRSLYRCDVVYAASPTLGFDYLRDRLRFGRSTRRSVGARVLESLHGNSGASARLMRPLHAAIIDEADHVLIDDATSPLVLSDRPGGGSGADDLLDRAGKVASRLVDGNHYLVDAAGGRLILTEAGFAEIYDAGWPIGDGRLRRPWHDYVIAALRASRLYQRDRDYVVRGNAIQIVDRSTGRIFTDRSWSGGLQQAIEIKEGMQPTAETESVATTTRQQFFGRYRWLGGMTGTATGCENEFASVYGCEVRVVPLRVPGRRLVLADAVFATADAKHRWIADEARVCRQLGRPVLIGTLSIEESELISAAMTCHGLKHEVLSGVQDRAEASIVSAAGSRGAITVATNLAGRGTDIRLDADARAAGGLHVVVASHHRLARIDRQLIGRCARGGDPGTARFCLSAEDELPTSRATWLASLIRRHLDSSETIDCRHGDLKRPTNVPPGGLRRHVWDVQEQQQRLESRLRIAALRRKQRHDVWQTPTRVWEPDTILTRR